MKYSIIYGVIRPKIAKQLSVGIIIVDGDEISVRYSTKNMNELQSINLEPPLMLEKGEGFTPRVTSLLIRDARIYVVKQ